MSATLETAKHAPTPRFEAEERAYFIARSVLLLSLVVLYLLGILSGASFREHQLYIAAVGLLLLDSAVLAILILGPPNMAPERAFMVVLVPDLVAFAAMTYLGKPDDSFYPVILVAPIFYALVVSKRAAIIAGFADAFAYSVGLLFIGPQTTAAAVLLAVKVATVPLVTIIVATAVDKQRSREEFAELSASETEQLNTQLRKRVHELQAVSEITEMVHSSLDFDGVGAQVLEIVAQAIGVSTCSIFVIDKEKAETLFSASRGTETDFGSAAVISPYSPLEDTHLTCVPVFDHGQKMVLFCTTAEEFARLSDDDRLVLGAVASELVVAVENSRLYKLTSRLAITDELTGLANYRHLQQRLDDEIARAIRFRKHLSLLMLDADDFKAFNDAEGHVTGDGALAELGDVLREVVREVDLVARYGGEEFSVVLPETDAAGAFIAAEKLREAVELHDFRNAEGVRASRLSISVGLATFPTHAHNKDELFREADDALYHAKNGGKNRVRAPQRHNEDADRPIGRDADTATDEWTGA